jgi:Holliday junction resolvase RusA-like endonuclease
MPVEVRQAQEDIARVTTATANREGIVFAPDSDLRFTALLTFKTKRGDLDNVAKRTIDAMARALGIDDARFTEIHLYRYLGEPGLEAQIKEVDSFES